MAHNTLPQVFARMGLLPHVEQTFYVEFEGNLAYNGASPALQPRENSSYNAYGGFLFRPPLLILLRK
jgi:hypothetical protein